MSNDSVSRDLRKALLEVVGRHKDLRNLTIQEARSRPEIASMLIKGRFSTLGTAGRESVLAQIFPDANVQNQTGKEPVAVA